MVLEINCSAGYFSGSSEYSEYISRSFIATSVLRSVLTILATISNILIIVSIKRTTSLHTPSYLLVVSLSASDLCVGLFVQPLHTATQVMYSKRYLHIKCVTFILYVLVGPFLITVSCFTMTAISSDRFLAIYTHSRYRTVVTRKRTIVGIIIIWVVAGVGSNTTITSGKTKAFHIWGLVSGVFCLVVSSLSFFASVRLLHQRQLQTRTMNVLAERSFNFGKYKRSLVTMAYVYALYLVCYGPLFVYFVLYVFYDTRNVLFQDMVMEVFYVNSTLNSFVYFWRNKTLRMAVRTIIGLTDNRHEITV